jgi:hypothetical protein
VLHILNGDETAGVFDGAGVTGDRLIWRDILVEGPLGPAGTAEARAHYLAARFDIDPQVYAREFAEERRALESAPDHDEIVLWFEQDLFCAVNLCFLLDWLGRRPPSRLTLVWPAEPLSALGTGALGRAYAARTDVGPAAQAAASAAWHALASDDPRAILRADVSALPFLDEALQRQLHRFPSVLNGLDEIEGEALAALDEGPLDFHALFARVTHVPTLRRHGMGDVQLAGDLAALASGDAPLVARDGTLWHLTPAGRETRAGRRDRIVTLGIDRWLGGVRLLGRGPVWRWDRAHATLGVR